MLEWMETHHNGMSYDWLHDRDMCIGNIEHLVITHKPSARPLPDSPPWDAWIKKLKLPRRRDEKVLRFLCERAWQYGEVSKSSDWIDVDIPSKSLRGVHRNYKGVVSYLESEGIVQVVREAILPTVEGKGKCRRYRLPACRWSAQPLNTHPVDK